jgi:hypothetical protein
VLNGKMDLKILKTLTLPCSTHWQQCEKNTTCINCFDPFQPAFTMDSFNTCDDFRTAFMDSCSSQCDTDNIQLQNLEQCVADELFYILTLGAATSFCSIYGTEAAESEL